MRSSVLIISTEAYQLKKIEVQSKIALWMSEIIYHKTDKRYQKIRELDEIIKHLDFPPPKICTPIFQAKFKETKLNQDEAFECNV